METKLNLSNIVTAVCLVIICVLLIQKGCNDKTFTPVTNNVTDSLKTVIAEQIKQKDSLIILANKSSVVRDSIITRWRTVIKPITLTEPCDSVLPIVINTCDSIITADSLHIADLKQVIKIDSNIIANQSKVIKMDSLTISALNQSLVKLSKKNRNLKIQRNILAVTTLAGVFIR